MKKIIVSLFVAALMVPAVSMARPARTGFMKTTARVDSSADYDQICRSEFGRYAQAADWSDVIQLFQHHPSMADFIEDTGLVRRPMSALLTHKGRKAGPNGMAYFVQFRDHKQSRHSERVVADIGNHLFELKVRMQNSKPVLCFIPPRHRGEPDGNHHGRHEGRPEDRRPEDRRPDNRQDDGPGWRQKEGRDADMERRVSERAEQDSRQEERVTIKHNMTDVDANPNSERMVTEKRGPRLLSTGKSYREWAYLDKVCKKEFGEQARVADWRDVKKMTSSKKEFDEFLEIAGINPGDRERLIYFNGLFKSPKDRHYYLVFNPRGNTPNGVTPIDSIRNHVIDAAAIMHMRARVLCFVP